MKMENYEYKFTKKFQRKYSKLKRKDPKLNKVVFKSMMKLLKNPFNRSLRTHKVDTPHFKRAYSSRVTKDIRIIWIFSKKEEHIINLLDIGGHEGSQSVY